MSNALLSKLADTSPRKDDQNILTFQHRGYLILMGRNAFSNERLIKEHPHPTCIWMHALAARGCHVILCIADKTEPDESVLQHAARLALTNSRSQARTVSMAFVKDLFKPDNGGVGVWKANRPASLEVAA